MEDTMLVSYKQVKLANLVECDQKALFSTANTPRCREGRYSFPWIAPLYPWHASVKHGGIKYHF